MSLVLVGQLAACAGRDPQMIATVQPQDMTSDCAAIYAQINANTERLASLNKESGNTTAGNVALGVVGLVLFWPALFAMDFKDAAGKEAMSLQQRQNYLAQLMAQRGCSGTGPALPMPMRVQS
jgi:hypothetical protein